MSPLFEQPECVRDNYAHNKERTQSLKERNLSLSVFIVTKSSHFEARRKGMRTIGALGREAGRPGLDHNPGKC